MSDSKKNEELTPERIKVLVYLARTKKKHRIHNNRELAARLKLGSHNTIDTACKMFIRFGYAKLAKSSQSQTTDPNSTIHSDDVEITQVGTKQLEPLLHVVGMRHLLVLVVATLLYGITIGAILSFFSLAHHLVPFVEVMLLTVVPYAGYFYFISSRSRKAQTDKLLEMLTEQDQNS